MGVLREGGGGNRGVGADGGVTEGIKLSRIRTALHIMKLSPQNSFGGSYSWSIARLRAIRVLNALSAQIFLSHF